MPIALAPDHPLAPLSAALDSAHARSYSDEDCDHGQCKILQIAQAHSPIARKIIVEVSDKLQDCIGQDPDSLIEKEVLRDLQTAHFGSPQEVVKTIKQETARICTVITDLWALQNSTSPLYKESTDILAQVRQYGMSVTPEENIKTGFRTPAAFTGNQYLLNMQVLAREMGLEGVTVERMMKLSANNPQLARLFATTRKDVFMSLHNILALQLLPVDRLFVTYNPRAFELVGSEEAGTLQTAVTPKTVDTVVGTIHGLKREECPSIGRAFKYFADWQKKLYERYFVEKIEKWKRLDNPKW